MTTTLTGLPSDDPTPRTAREFRWAQGASTGGGTDRAIVLVGNKTSAGSETVETLGTPILSQDDCNSRFGTRSEIAWMYRKATAVDPTCTYYAVAVAENGAGTAASVVFTFTTTADGNSTILIDWAGERIQVGVASGDTAIVQCAAAVAAVNARPDLPFTATQGAPANDHKMTITTSGLGPRYDQIVNRVRVSYATTIATTVAKAAITSGTNADDMTLAIAELKNREIYYHAIAQTAVAGVTTTDNGVGEYIEFIRSYSAPTYGFDHQVIVACIGSQSQASAVATSAAFNSVYAKLVWQENNDWTTGMIAAHYAAIKRLAEVTIHPGANINGWVNSDSKPFGILEPFSKADRPTATEIKAALNDGVSPIAFFSDGTAYIVRDITSYSWVGSSATKDYRAREGHIPSTIHFAWNVLRSRYNAVKQPFAAESDPPQGQKPLKGFMYASRMRRLIEDVIDDLTGPYFNGSAVLDPDKITEMKNSIVVDSLADGFAVTVAWQPVRHDNKALFLIQQQSPAY